MATKSRVLVLALVVLGSLLGYSRFLYAEDSELARRALTSELAVQLLGSEESFLKLPNDDGWFGIVLAQPGSSLAPLMHAYDVQTGSPTLLQYLANVAVFDRPLTERRGLGYFRDRPLSIVWSDFLARSMPRVLLVRDIPIQPKIARWIFAEQDAVDRARGLADVREPSAYVASYREYQALYGLVAPGAGDDAWRLHPRLSSYRSLKEARDALVSDWIVYGYKREVEGALRLLDQASKSEAWKEWTTAKAALNYNQEFVDSSLSVPKTLLLPGPASWSEIGNWLRLKSRDFSTETDIDYQISRVRVLRPWMRLEALTGGALDVDHTDRRNSMYVLSDGTRPTFEQSPNGEMAMIVEELILVTHIRVPGVAGTQPRSHPLALFAYPDAINLLGYVVRVLPKYPR